MNKGKAKQNYWTNKKELIKIPEHFLKIQTWLVHQLRLDFIF
ncbi:hypothetical protein GGD38_001870 [Chitinophagaceae bacterium OAS944]|nr:hypothetical protein [Chitinophagaceae bacterium OAS944]